MSIPTSSAAPASNTQARQITGWRRFCALPLALVVRLWNASLRFELDAASLALYSRKDTAIAFVLWHSRLFIVAEIGRRFRQGRPVYGLVSASKDGAWLATFFEMVGIRSVRGSSSRMGREAASALIDTLRQGNDIGITPDGPRGPAGVFKPGALIVTRRAKVPMLLVGAHFSCALRLRSWDRFVLPLPFSKVRLRAEWVAPEDAIADREAEVARLESLLRSINPDN